MKVVIIGTGLTNSLLAGALSRTDYEVVQIDCLDQYGGEEFPMKTLEQLLSMPESLISIYSSMPSKTDSAVPATTSTIPALITAKLKLADPDSMKILEGFLSKFTKRYLLELNSQAIYSCGPIVDLLVKSSVGDGNLEFQLVKDLMHSPPVLNDCEIRSERVPCSKEDIFVNDSISLREKRIVMKFFKSCLESAGEDSYNGTFLDFISSHKLPTILQEKIAKCLTLTINQDQLKTLTRFKGVEAICLYLKSIGKYGSGALLTANYGTGSELCQAFCRYAAVYGVTSALRCHISEITSREEHGRMLFSVKTDLETFSVNILVCSCAQMKFISKKGPILSKFELDSSLMWHLMIISENSLLSSSQHIIQLFTETEAGAFSVQYRGDSGMCPDGSFILHLWSMNEGLLQRLERILTLNCTCISIKYPTYSSYITGEQTGSPYVHLTDNVDDNLISCENAVSRAKVLFNLIAGNDYEFYPAKES